MARPYYSCAFWPLDSSGDRRFASWPSGRSRYAVVPVFQVWLFMIGKAVAVGGDAQFLAEVTSFVSRHFDTLVQFASDGSFFFGISWLAFLIIKPDRWWPRIQQADSERDGQMQEMERIRGLLGQETSALRECKKEHAKATLRWFATRQSMNIEKYRAEDPSVKDIRVTVRFAEYKDRDFAKQIEGILKECTQWPVEIDLSNKPIIMPDKDFKVIFNIGPWESFSEVALAFTQGKLVPGNIGQKRTERGSDQQHLIIDVLPTIMP